MHKEKNLSSQAIENKNVVQTAVLIFSILVSFLSTPLHAEDKAQTLLLANSAITESNNLNSKNESWLTVIRESPYWVSKGMYTNLVTIRNWVLAGKAYCEQNNRHILFDNRARFLGYLENGDTAESTQRIINDERQKLFQQKRVDRFIPGADDKTGYPFALSCDQPHADLALSFARYAGLDEQALLWGTWDGMTIGSKENLVSLHEALAIVYKDRIERKHVSLPPEVLSTLAGTILIESGGRKHAHSTANARGILQLSPEALKDCNLAEKFHFHRMAQIDCAFQLLEINHRNLIPVFEKTFSGIEPEKFERLYALLLIQAYHGGVGRVNALMTDPELNKATLYFAKHHAQYSAEDIALGMIYHNLGRNLFGFNSLYYVTDVGIAKSLVCKKYPDLAGCS